MRLILETMDRRPFLSVFEFGFIEYPIFEYKIIPMGMFDLETIMPVSTIRDKVKEIITNFIVKQRIRIELEKNFYPDDPKFQNLIFAEPLVCTEAPSCGLVEVLLLIIAPRLFKINDKTRSNTNITMT